MFLLAPLRSRPMSHRARIKVRVRAVRYHRGGMFLAALLNSLRAPLNSLRAPAGTGGQVTGIPPDGARHPAADLSPPMPRLLARTLTAAPAAPPARVPCPAGTAG